MGRKNNYPMKKEEPSSPNSEMETTMFYWLRTLSLEVSISGMFVS